MGMKNREVGGAGETAQRFRVPTVLTNNLSLVPSTYINQLTFNSNSMGLDALLWPPQAPACTCTFLLTETHRPTHIHRTKPNQTKKKIQNNAGISDSDFWASETAQKVKVLSVMSEDPSLMPGAHHGRRESLFLTSIHVPLHEHTPTYSNTTF